MFTFGSVPLKTYLPDGDIDLTSFSKNQSSKETWAHQVRDMLENEEKNENAEFRVKEVQYIQAEVCLPLYFKVFQTIGASDSASPAPPKEKERQKSLFFPL